MTSQNPTRKQLLPYPPSRPSPQKVTNKDKTNEKPPQKMEANSKI